MTDSQVENLLRQMPLAEPSAALDDKVEAFMRASEPLCVSAVRRLSSWGGTSVVAAACLVIGLFVGHIFGPAFATNDRISQGNGEPVVGANLSGQMLDGGHGEHTSKTVVTVDWTRDRVSGPQMQGPRVAMFCAISGKNFVTSKEQQCLRCHDGITVAETDFRREHMNSPGFETCMWCHDTSVRREVRN
ncbi:MAG: hypothetical protein GY826_12155 [Fuerstiella sp.]|nr:hypothetical protein [Fuerstiella sp.]